MAEVTEVVEDEDEVEEDGRRSNSSSGVQSGLAVRRRRRLPTLFGCGRSNRGTNEVGEVDGEDMDEVLAGRSITTMPPALPTCPSRSNSGGGDGVLDRSCPS
jgi:hypothetical protein